MRCALALAVLLLLATGAVAQDDSVGVAAISDRYAQSIYGCVVKLGYKTLAAVIDASSYAKMFKDPKTQVTVFAPDNSALLEFIEDTGVPLAVLLKQKTQLDLLVSYHVLTRRHTTQFWPPRGQKAKLVNTMLKGPITKAPLQLKLYSDADGDFQVEAVDNEAELNCPGKINLVCGQSVVHSIDEVLMPVAEEEDDRK